MYNFRITIRRLLKDRAFLLVNVFGLVIGISSFFILFIYVSNEKSFDKHIAGHENIYRVISTAGISKDSPWARSLGIVHSASSEIPEVELATQFVHCPVGTIKIDDDSFYQNDILWVNDAFIEMFEVKSKVGDLSELEQPNTVFISEDFARRHYGSLNPVGQIIKFEAGQYKNDIGDYEIRGIVKNAHSKTHLKYELLASQKGNMQRSFEKTIPNLKRLWAYHYFKLQKGASPELVAKRIAAFWDKSSLKQEGGPKEWDFSLFPLDDIHLKSDFRFELRESSSKINISLFIIVSFIILLVSLLNFTNLTVAKLIKRSKELGLKKSIGANQWQIIRQVLTEALIVCVLSIGISLLFVQSANPFVNQLFDIEFKIFFNEPAIYWSILAVIGVSLTVTALFVAVFFLRRNSTIDILAQRNNFSGSYLLKSLLVGQVAIVVVLASGTFLVNKQIDFVLNKPLGFDKENIVVLHMKDLRKDSGTFTKELKNQSQVTEVGMAYQYFGYPTQKLELEGFGIEGTAELVAANYDYLKTMNIKLIENWINPTADTIRGMVINNHLYKRLMEKHSSIEELNSYLQTQPMKRWEAYYRAIKIIGVVEDFNYNSAHETIGDFVFSLDEARNRARFAHIRLNEGGLHAGMDAIKRVWSEYFPNQEMDYFFMDEKVAQQYKAETTLVRILFAFSSISILISIIGISALALFISQQRTKEIGIRKVNGAKISEILTMLNKDFVKWVAIAFVIACPVAWYAMNKWLENFAYKTSLSWWIFALAGLLALGIALLTVSFQSWKAATRNPVEALRYE
ncbi:ABC transporter permease [Sunxiuqinia elliptica]|uniref:Putative ABC transport system permease protein n=1 Tax=Sunxiuqinia elliptica TaxID=655355 RepID=A0A1I2AGQ0_9BACT|nr:ABC transporter permease [Sunxiuqinia elliptica]SFE42959.1 putative ABC transport system permease protein [Sunxiuqinia elliptica]